MYVKFPKEQKDEIIRHIQQYFSEERSVEIGQLAAENFLHFVTKEIGPFYYNQALRDAQNVIDQTLSSAEEELLSLQRPVE